MTQENNVCYIMEFVRNILETHHLNFALKLEHYVVMMKWFKLEKMCFLRNYTALFQQKNTVNLKLFHFINGYSSARKSVSGVVWTKMATLNHKNFQRLFQPYIIVQI